MPLTRYCQVPVQVPSSTSPVKYATHHVLLSTRPEKYATDSPDTARVVVEVRLDETGDGEPADDVQESIASGEGTHLKTLVNCRERDEATNIK